MDRAPTTPPRRRVIDPRNIEVIDDATVARLRDMSAEQRLRVASNLNASAERVLLENIRFDRPTWTEEQVRAEVRRRLGRAPG